MHIEFPEDPMLTQDFSAQQLDRYERDRKRRRMTETNVGTLERIATAIAGGALVGYGTTRRDAGGILMAIGGGAILLRAATGHCPLYRALGVTQAEAGKSPAASVAHGRGIKVEKSITINRSREELFHFWRNLENLPEFMSHVRSVKSNGPNRSHWTVTGPAGTTVEWDAEIHNEQPPEFLAWRTVGDSDINHAGSVHFDPAPGGRGTEVRVILNYEPPAGQVGAMLAKLFGEDPEQQLDEDLRRLKQFLETAEIPTTLGQPTGPATIRPSDQPGY
jgi:uncharacterized membrane protein